MYTSPDRRPERFYVPRSETPEALEQQRPVGHLWAFVLFAVVAIAGILLVIFIQAA